jgi:MYXO-CTERM domain-containing protein
VTAVSVPIVVALLVLALLGMAWSWRRRRRAQGGIALPPVPAELGATRLTVPGLLVATTFSGRPLDRVVADGLGFRAQATLSVTDGGVLVERAGGAPFLVPAGSSAGTASWALDKGVERDGLTVLAWSLVDGDGAAVPVESAFRLPPDTQAALLAALRSIDPHPTDQEAPHADG